MTTLLSSISESHNYHIEAVLLLAPRISDIFEGDLICLRKYRSILTHKVTCFVATYAFLEKKQCLLSYMDDRQGPETWFKASEFRQTKITGPRLFEIQMHHSKLTKCICWGIFANSFLQNVKNPSFWRNHLKVQKDIWQIFHLAIFSAIVYCVILVGKSFWLIWRLWLKNSFAKKNLQHFLSISSWNVDEQLFPKLFIQLLQPCYT